jgi:hypothetical protein
MERVVYRELFPAGLTVLDPLEGIDPGRSWGNAKQEVAQLVAAIRNRNIALPGRTCS